MTMKICSQCQIEKPETEFYRNTRPNGKVELRANCKPCSLKSTRRWIDNHPEQIAEWKATNHDKVIQSGRKSRERNRDKERERSRRDYQKRRDQNIASSLRYAKENRDVRAAHQAVFAAVKKGLLVKQPCEICGNKIAEAHHDDYNKPLEVRWLCRSHHRQHHAERGETAFIPRTISRGANNVSEDYQ